MDLFGKITPHTTVLTPNRRLAAVIQKKYAHWQVQQNKTCWKTLDVLPLYPSWLERTWKTYAARNMNDQNVLLTTHQEQLLWEKIVREDPENENLLQISDTAKLAKSAWETLNRWRVDIADPILKLTEDSRAFLKWANKFKKTCAQQRWVDQNSIANNLAALIQTDSIPIPKHLILTGFTEIAPQFQHLLSLYEQKGTLIEYYENSSRNEKSERIAIIDSETEIATMARWSKEKLSASLSIGCIVPNLESQRESIMRIFGEVFGEEKFNISAGRQLISYPIIQTAIQLLNLHKKTDISIAAMSNLLRTPFIGAAEQEKYKRAQFDIRLRNSNIHSVSLQKILDENEKINLNTTCPNLAKHLSQFLNISVTGNYFMSEWVPIFTSLLKQLGWPGERSMNSHEYQVVQNSWLPLLNELNSFDNILGKQTYSNALHYLTCLISNTVFQPESPESPVQILGLLEAAEIPFENLWVMGLDDSSWPAKPKPNPFIPLKLQKSLNMPNASADRELIYCQKLTRQLQESSQYCIFSYPLQREDAELRPSSLLKNIPEISIDALRLSPFTSQAENIYHTQQFEWLKDDMAPAITQTDTLTGGVSIFKKQAECPFKAFAELRLHAKRMEETSLGLRPLDRGNIVHKALEYTWKTLQSSSALILESDESLKQIIQQCAQKALSDIIQNEQISTTRYFSLELQRLEKLIWDWLQLEKARPAFKVIFQEKEMTTTIGKITVNVRVDRIDELADGNHLIIDYKTGKYNDSRKWFSARPEEPQLPIYCIADPEKTIGIAFAQVHPSAMEWIGASKIPIEIKSVKLLAEIKQADATLWEQQTKLWEEHLKNLGDQFLEGHAQVDPKDANLICRQCDLQPFCRIHEISQYDYDE
jgi:probable DNA repair protein